MEDFSQKAKKSFKMGLDFLQKKAKEQVDRAKLQTQLTKVKEDKQQALITLAERVCVMFDMDTFSPEELKDSVESVREFQQQILDLEKQIQEVVQGDESHEDEPPQA
ncbi:MAG: hypothetical protein J0I12_04655 [Candidatus Eremiobacteraeota bacterium]|nr:hypothetical protein [Candidatus Eremiobacteraeota bacterium]